MEKTTALPVFDTTAPYNIKREYYKTGFECFQKKFIFCLLYTSDAADD